MRLVMMLLGPDPALFEAQAAFHLRAGVDVVLVGDVEDDAELVVDAGRVFSARTADSAALARIAVESYGADWLLECRPSEFWFPRGDSLKDVLAPIPDRYCIVQGLVRSFVAVSGDDSSAGEVSALRRASARGTGDRQERLERQLRFAYRARAAEAVGRDRASALDGRVPLRAWYPIEVLRLPRSGQADELLSCDDVERELAAGKLVEDTRLRDALRRVTDGAEDLGLRSPTVVDDIEYAADCADVGEVDFEPLMARISELERRVMYLEARFWPSFRSRLRRLARRPS